MHLFLGSLATALEVARQEMTKHRAIVRSWLLSINTLYESFRRTKNRRQRVREISSRITQCLHNDGKNASRKTADIHIWLIGLVLLCVIVDCSYDVRHFIICGITFLCVDSDGRPKWDGTRFMVLIVKRILASNTHTWTKNKILDVTLVMIMWIVRAYIFNISPPWICSGYLKRRKNRELFSFWLQNI